MQKDNDKGYTMVETIMYISILIVLGGVLASYAHKVMVRYRTGRAAQQVIDLKRAILHFTATDEDYSNLSVSAMVLNNSLPFDMRSGDPSRAIHALGGEVKIGPVSIAPLSDTSSSKNFMFFIQFKGLPKGSCVEILTQGQFYGDGSEMDTLIVNGKNAWQYQHSFYDVSQYYDGSSSSITLMSLNTSPQSVVPSIRPTIAQAAEVCTSKDNNNIVWVFS